MIFKDFIFRILNLKFSEKKNDKSFDNQDAFAKNIIEIYNNSTNYYAKDDLIYFDNVKCYCAFKYSVVKDILNSGERLGIGVSKTALNLNKIYFSKNEEIHRYNKKTTINHLDFLSSKHQYSDDDFTLLLFNIFIEAMPKDETINLEDYLINPIVFLSIIKEYDFLDIFHDLDPISKNFSCIKAISIIKGFFEDGDRLENIIRIHINKGGSIPEKMSNFLYSLKTKEEFSKEDWPAFFRSIIFVAIETTTSFISTFIFTIFSSYPHLLTKNSPQKDLYDIANEVLRIYPPVAFVYRTVWQNTVYSNIHLKEGDMLILFVGAANLDPEVFYDPKKILTGRNEKHLSFGSGNYACIGRFAAFRMAMNIFSYMAPYHDKLTLIDSESKHYFHNAIQKIELKFIYGN